MCPSYVGDLHLRPCTIRRSYTNKPHISTILNLIHLSLRKNSRALHEHHTKEGFYKATHHRGKRKFFRQTPIGPKDKGTARNACNIKRLTSRNVRKWTLEPMNVYRKRKTTRPGWENALAFSAAHKNTRDGTGPQRVSFHASAATRGDEDDEARFRLGRRSRTGRERICHAQVRSAQSCVQRLPRRRAAPDRYLRTIVGKKPEGEYVPRKKEKKKEKVSSSTHLIDKKPQIRMSNLRRISISDDGFFCRI